MENLLALCPTMNSNCSDARILGCLAAGTAIKSKEALLTYDRGSPFGFRESGGQNQPE